MAMAAVTQGAVLPEDATREQLMAYHKILDMQRHRLLRQQRELDERKRRADESSLRRAELSSIGGSSSHANGQHHKSRSRINNIPERERREATRDLGNSFMTIDSAGNIMPKTPEGALVAATTYLMANPPPSGDPRYGVYRTALAGIGIVGAALDKTPADRAVATRRSNHSPSTRQPAAPSTREPESASGRRRPRHPHPKEGRQGPSGARQLSSHPTLRTKRRHATPLVSPASSAGPRCQKATRYPRIRQNTMGSQEPKSWLDDYRVAVKCNGGTRVTAMQCLQLHLKGAARAWLKSLPPDSIGSWGELKESFTRNFQSTYKRPASIEELRACKQKSNESIRSYIGRWTILKNAAEGISEERAIDAFNAGIRRRELKEELGRVKPKTIAHLMDIANSWADGEDAVHNSRNRSRSPDEDDAEGSRRRDRRRKRKDRGYDDADGTEFVGAGFAGKRDGENRVTGDRNSGYRTSNYRNNGDRGADDYRRKDNNPRPRRDDGPSGVQLLSGPCNIHFYTDSDGNRKSSHLMKDCRQFQRMLEAYTQMHTAAPPRATQLPGAIAHGAPPPPPLHMVAPPIVVGQQPQQQQRDSSRFSRTTLPTATTSTHRHVEVWP